MIELNKNRSNQLRQFLNHEILSMFDQTNYSNRFKHLPDQMYDIEKFQIFCDLIQNYLTDMKHIEIKKEEQDSPILHGFPKEFLDIYDQFFTNPRHMVGGHGTTKENANKIMEEGLYGYGHFWKNLLNLKYEQRFLDRLKNWPHKDYRTIVIFDFPPLDLCPLWQNVQEMNQKQNLAYHIGNQYILGILDLDTLEFTKNKHHAKEYHYDPTHPIFDVLDHSTNEQYIDGNNIGRLYEVSAYLINTINTVYHNQLTKEEFTFIVEEFKDILSKMKNLIDQKMNMLQNEESLKK